MDLSYAQIHELQPRRSSVRVPLVEPSVESYQDEHGESVICLTEGGQVVELVFPNERDAKATARRILERCGGGA